MDALKNFAIGTASTGYDDAATSVVLTTGHGARFPTTAFYGVWWNSTDYTSPADDPNVEIVRVTARSTDTLTVTRAQEGTSASTKNTSAKTYSFMQAVTAALLAQIRPVEYEATFDGQGQVIVASIKKYIPVERSGTITAASVVADVSGSITMTFKRYTPSGGALGSATTLGTVALSSAVHNRDTTLSGWTTSVTVGDVIEISTTATIATVTRVTTTLKVE